MRQPLPGWPRQQTFNLVEGIRGVRENDIEGPLQMIERVRKPLANNLPQMRHPAGLSVLLDGGLSYLLITGVQKLLGKQSKEDKAYSEGYLQAIKEVQKQTERRIARNPNDRDAIRDLNNIKEEYSKISADSSLPKSVRDDFDINAIKRLNSIDTEEGKNPRKRFEQDNGFDRDL